MPVAEHEVEDEQPLTRLPFPPLRKSHILHCSYHHWHPRYRSITPKARLIPLTAPFLSYLRSDGIILPSDGEPAQVSSDTDSGIFSASDDPNAPDDDEADDIAAEWRDVHTAIKTTIAELGGKVVPKLNWSAPKDATWISATNSLECRTPNDIYLLLKSSDFVTHDLEHAFDETVDEEQDTQIPYVLVLRKFFQLNPSVEFRCFVRNRKLLCLCQRDLNHFDFLFKMRDELVDLIQQFFDIRLRDTFPDDNFVFDIYVPPPHDRVWLVDINPWAQRTDPLLFSWLEILTMPEPRTDAGLSDDIVRLQIGQSADMSKRHSDSDSEDEVDEDIFTPELRLVARDDPEAYSFNTPQYSAHKLPREVVDASTAGDANSLRDFAANWQDILAKRQRQDEDDSSSADD